MTKFIKSLFLLGYVKKAAIFDFDGVIFDTELKRFNDVKASLKGTRFHLNKSHFKVLLGKKTDSFLKEVFQDISKEELERIMRARRELQYKAFEKHSLIKGIGELLIFLKSRNFKIALCTGSQQKFVVTLLREKGLIKYFDLLVTGELFFSSKPDPECYQVALGKLGVTPGEAIIVEDSVNGILAAKAAGCAVFGITTYFEKQELSQADYVFEDHLEILRFLKKSFEDK